MQRQYYPLRMEVNGRDRQISVEPHEFLLDVLRDRLSLTGAKRSCDVQVCGACTVLVDGRAVSACTYLAVDAHGKKVLTIEGLADPRTGELHPIQKAFIDNYAVQCGFCTPGIIMTTKALLDKNASPTQKEIREAVNSHICRCTGYLDIFKAISAAAENIGKGGGRK